MKFPMDENTQQANVQGGTDGRICGAAELQGLLFENWHNVWYFPHCPNESNQAEPRGWVSLKELVF